MNSRCAVLFFVLSWSAALWLHAAPPKGTPEELKTLRVFGLKVREASTAFERGDFSATMKKIEEAEALIPNDPATLNLRGAVLYKEKKYDEALVVFRQLIDRETNSYPGYFNMAEVKLAQKKYDEALAAFERILEARPADEICQYRVVLTLALSGKLDEARRRAKKMPNPGQTAAFYYANAAIEFIAGNADQGRNWIEKSETFFPAETSVKLREVLVEQKLIPK